MTDFTDTKPEIYFVTLAEIIDDYKGNLSAYITAMSARNIIITMQADVAIGKAKPRPHAVALAVTVDKVDPEDLAAQAQHFFDKKLPFAFGWVPADTYGSDDFGIFIEQGEMGDLLANGMIDEIVQSAQVEKAVEQLSTLR